jgi:hypothetical protein
MQPRWPGAMDRPCRLQGEVTATVGLRFGRELKVQRASTTGALRCASTAALCAHARTHPRMRVRTRTLADRLHCGCDFHCAGAVGGAAVTAGWARFGFDDLCGRDLGAADYLGLTERHAANTQTNTPTTVARAQPIGACAGDVGALCCCGRSEDDCVNWQNRACPWGGGDAAGGEACITQ